MADNTILGGMIFATKQATAEEVNKLIKAALDENGNFKGGWKTIVTESSIGYSRGWLIVRREHLVRTQPNLIVNADALVQAFVESGKVTTLVNPKDLEAAALSGVVKELHKLDGSGESWGEIMVRLGRNEGIVRKAFEYGTTLRSLGQRTGRGGRFAAGRADLYTDNMVKQGAHVPVGVSVRTIAKDELVNFVPKEGTKKALAAKRAPRKVAASKKAVA